MGRPRRTESPTLPAPGDFVLVRYSDHVLFRDSDASHYLPWNRETVGRLDYEDGNSVRLLWEWFAEPDPTGNAKIRSSGLALLKKTILEMRKLG